MIKRLLIFLILFSGHTVFAQEDVCDGVTEATISPTGSFSLCWKRNPPNDNVDHYKVFDNPIEIDPYTPNFGEELHLMQDSACLPIHCITPMMPAPTEVGVHYLTVRGFDSNARYSGPSNSVILTIVLTVRPEPAENLRVRVISQ